MIEVIIDMKNENALYTVSMLAAFAEKWNKNYMDLLKPFLLHCLPSQIGEGIDIEIISKKMTTKFGFEKFPRKVAEKILDQLSQEKKTPYIKKEKGKKAYTLLRQPDNSSFDAEQQKMREKIDSVLRDLQTYLGSNYVYQKLSLEKLKEALVLFFEVAGLTVYRRNLEELQAITDQKGNFNYYIARSVVEEFKKASLTYERLVDIAKGFMSYKAIYYITGEHVLAPEAKLHNLSVFLDCSLVIDALNYDTTADFEAIRELIKLIRSLGGQVYVFRHTLNEAANTIEAFANQTGRANSFCLDNLAAKKYTKEIILSLANRLEEELKKTVAVSVIDAPDITDKRNYATVLDETKIVTWLSQHRVSNVRDENNSVDRTQRHNYDADSLIAINQLRRGQHPRQIEHAKAILLTQDTLLNRCMKDLYGTNAEVPLTFIDVDLAAILWLRTNKANSLPSDILISNASAACQPSHEIIMRAIELAEQLEKNNDIPKDAAVFVGNYTEFKPYIADAFSGSRDHSNEEQLRNALVYFINNLYGEKIAEAEERQKENAAVQIGRLAREKSALEEKHNREVQTKDQRIAQLEKKLRQKEANDNAERKRIIEEAQKYSERKAKQVRWACIAVITILTLALIAIFATQAIFQIYENSGSWWINMLVAIISAIGAIALYLHKDSFAWKMINRLCARVQMKTYSKRIDEFHSKYSKTFDEDHTLSTL